MKATMKQSERNIPVTLLLMLLLLALVPFMPATAHAFSGGGHYFGTEAATKVFGVGVDKPPLDPTMIDRNRPVPLYPELELFTDFYDPKDPIKGKENGDVSAILGEPFGRADNKVEWIKKVAF